MGVCNCTMFCCTLLYVHSSIAIILMGKRELVILLNLSSWCLVMVELLFLAVPWCCLRFVIVVFSDHTHYFLCAVFIKLNHLCLQTRVAALKITPNNCFYIMNDHFPHNPIFLKISCTYLIIVCVLFHVNMLDQTQNSLIIPFSNDIYFRLVSTSGFNVTLKRSLRWHMLKVFFNFEVEH